MRTVSALATPAEDDAEKAGDTGITELEKFEPSRVDGVKTPANGFPILMMKGIAPAPTTTAQPAAPELVSEPAPSTAEPEKAKKAKKPKKAHKSADAGDPGEKGAMLIVKQLQESGVLPTPDAISKAVTEALAPSEERFKTLEEGLAKVLATPIPGGPQLVTSHTQRPAANPAVEKAERYRAIAAQTSDPEVKASYLELAARAEGQSPKDPTP